MPVINRDKYVEIDAEKLKDCISSLTGLTQVEFAAEIGRSKKYISNMHGKARIPDYVFNIICKRIGVEADCLIWKEQEPERKDDQPVSILVTAINNLSDKIDTMILQGKQTQKLMDDLKKDITKATKVSEQAEENLSTILRKVNANTVQLERLKESVKSISETDYDRAKQFLQNALKDGRIEGTVLFSQADAACIKRSELMKARKEMNVQIRTTGYGNNQTAWWIKE